MYGIEVPFRRDLDAPRLVPAAVAAGAAYATRAALVGPRHLVDFAGVPIVDATFALGCLLVALGCGFGARLFALATEALHALAPRIAPWRRAAIGGVVLAALAWSGHALAGSWITFGPGYVAADWLAAGEHVPWLLGVTLLIRTAGTLTCVFGGGGGGVFTSLAVTGVFIGELVAQLARPHREQLPAAARRRVLPRQRLPHPARRHAAGRRVDRRAGADRGRPRRGRARAGADGRRLGVRRQARGARRRARVGSDGGRW